ncbi:efflux RND transporter periplasmic adaptor subunit [Ferrimonas balearica]|uniref:efflux RND transporter periplasmic adaptor subunit n=1 Tax=Ferrimonas balearica TaxID=44012 RepID=UPI001F3B5E3B|nr:efflux RND transporter periplasmic adaptor subunit [Ferrimonas balearica]MBY6019402.1 efflux RND transporter periplasmic adaptor subunit [Halomonas denitrificans]MBY6096246.1 efflux RND transporter periplasmic adaptor subunit [Ferrimonas balearica]
MCNKCSCGGQDRQTKRKTQVATAIVIALALTPVIWTLAQAAPGQAPQVTQSAAEHAAHTHACPMHPEQTGVEGDRCPICNMFLTEVEGGHADHGAATHTHACPMHPEETGVEGDRCPICNMFLTEVEGDDHADHGAATHTHACPMHPEETGIEGDRCPICNMFLTEMEEEEQVDPHAGHTMQLDPLPSAPALEQAVSGGEATIKYVCPMHPQIVSDEPGTCPICGMNLEKVEMGAASEEVVVGVSGGLQQALGVRTETVERGTLWRYIKTLGTVQYNEDAISHIHTRVTGWVEKLAVNSVGQQVEKGQLLYELYSPELVNAQDDYLQALDYLGQDPARGKELLRKAKLRLELLGISDKVIQRLEKTRQSLYRVPFYAPHSGVVSTMDIRDGMYIEPGKTQIELVDLSTVWVIADVFENEQSWLEVGRPADVTAAAQGLFEIEGEIDYIYPELDPVTRSLQVRVKLPNPENRPGGQLRPGSLVDVELYGGPRRGLLTVPAEALILTGRENRVVVQRADNSFASVPVRLGMMSQGKAEILEGLNEGDKVVVSGQFLIDSEASIQGSLRRMSQPPADAHSGHQH